MNESSFLDTLDINGTSSTELEDANPQKHELNEPLWVLCNNEILIVFNC